MDAKDLRIGNFLYKYGVIVKIVEIGVKHITDTNYYLRCEGSNCGYWIDQFKPIPLTEEILLKCGFEKCVNSFFKSDIGSLYLVRPFMLADYFLIKSNGGDKITNLKYLHELQNLYHSLTGKELIYNE